MVTVWVGANVLIDGVDPADFQDNLDDMLDRLDGTAALVAIADIPDLTGLPQFREDPISTVTAERIGPSTKPSTMRPRSIGGAGSAYGRARSKMVCEWTPTASIRTILVCAVSPIYSLNSQAGDCSPSYRIRRRRPLRLNRTISCKAGLAELYTFINEAALRP